MKQGYLPPCEIASFGLTSLTFIIRPSKGNKGEFFFDYNVKYCVEISCQIGKNLPNLLKISSIVVSFIHGSISPIQRVLLSGFF